MFTIVVKGLHWNQSLLGPYQPHARGKLFYLWRQGKAENSGNMSIAEREEEEAYFRSVYAKDVIYLWVILNMLECIVFTLIFLEKIFTNLDGCAFMNSLKNILWMISQDFYRICWIHREDKNYLIEQCWICYNLHSSWRWKGWYLFINPSNNLHNNKRKKAHHLKSIKSCKVNITFKFQYLKFHFRVW